MKHTLALQTGRISRPQKTVIYGPEGIGKSTLASQFPSPVFLDTEGGSHHLDITRLPAPKSWEDVTSAISALGSEEHEFRTFAVDTADWLEKLLIEHICQRSNKTNIEDFGYGKGYIVLAEEFTKFLASLDSLLTRGMHVLLLAYCRIVKFEQPEVAGAYDRYELKLTKQVAPLVKEW
jgi:GTPase SAR1 family protein